jgi:chromosome segregation ATPase
MGSPANFEARLAAVEARLEEVAADAAAARHLAAAHDRDLADVTVKVDAVRTAVNGLGVQTAARFDRLEQRFGGLEQRFGGLEHRVDNLEHKVDAGFAEMRSKFDQVDAGFMEMRAKFDQTAAGMQQIVDLLTRRGDDA